MYNIHIYMQCRPYKTEIKTPILNDATLNCNDTEKTFEKRAMTGCKIRTPKLFYNVIISIRNN